jgi:hypothetical protein
MPRRIPGTVCSRPVVARVHAADSRMRDNGLRRGVQPVLDFARFPTPRPAFPTTRRRPEIRSHAEDVLRLRREERATFLPRAHESMNPGIAPHQRGERSARWPELQRRAPSFRHDPVGRVRTDDPASDAAELGAIKSGRQSLEWVRHRRREQRNHSPSIIADFERAWKLRVCHGAMSYRAGGIMMDLERATKIGSVFRAGGGARGRSASPPLT